MSLGAWLSDVQKATETLTNGFLSERRTTPKRSRGSDGTTASEEAPFGEAECDWISSFVGGAVQASANSMAQAAHQRFTAVEAVQAKQQVQMRPSKPLTPYKLSSSRKYPWTRPH